MRLRFCRDSISFLSDIESTDIIELKTVAAPLVIDFEKIMEKTVLNVLEDLDEDRFATILLKSIYPSCRQLLECINFLIPQFLIIDVNSIVGLVRTTVLFLNHALVSYVGSHIIDADSWGILANGPSLNGGGADPSHIFGCSRVNLACLDAFVDEREVCVFRLHRNIPTDGYVRNPRRSVLARMTDIEDIWGPVYTVPSISGLVKYYGVSKGVICRVEAKKECPIKGAIPCHYFTRSSFFKRKASRLLSGRQDLLLAKDDLLLIGVGLRENPHCTYHVQDFCHDWASDMTVLGTQESVWKTDTRSLAIGFSKYIGVTLSGSQKLMPLTTRKQHILDKWTNAPERCNPGILNQYLGVEISHCTGNARRISLRQLMATEPISSIFERQTPGWSRTEWGTSLSQALRGRDDEAMFDVWKEYSLYRQDMAELFCGVFELLDSTGWKENGNFHAALIKLHDEERAVQIPQKLNDWTLALADTHLNSAYIMINEKCLSCEVPDHSTSTCNTPRGFTILQTRFVTKKSPGRLDRLDPQISHYRLYPFSYDLASLSCNSSEITLLAIKDKHLLQVRKRPTCVEDTGCSSDLANNVVFVRSSESSFHGRFTAKRADQPQPVAVTIPEPRITTRTIGQSNREIFNGSERISSTQHQQNGTPVEPRRSSNTHRSRHRSKRRGNFQYQQNGTPVEPHRSHNTHNSHHRSWISAFSDFILGKSQTKPKHEPKVRVSRVAPDPIGNLPPNQVEPLTEAAQRRRSEVDDEGLIRGDVYGQDMWYHADGTNDIANDMANYRFSDDSDENTDKGGYQPESSSRASQRGNGALR